MPQEGTATAPGPTNQPSQPEPITVARAATMRRIDALFRAMSSDFLLREQFVTDPVQVMWEYGHSSALAPEKASYANLRARAGRADDAPQLLRRPSQHALTIRIGPLCSRGAWRNARRLFSRCRRSRRIVGEQYGVPGERVWLERRLCRATRGVLCQFGEESSFLLRELLPLRSGRLR